MQRSLYDASSQQYYDGLDDVDEALDVFPAIHSMSLAASPTRPNDTARRGTSPLKTQLEWQLSNTATSDGMTTTAAAHSLLAGHHLYRYPSSSSAATSTTSCFLQQDNNDDDNDLTDTATSATNAGSPLPPLQPQRLQQTQLGLPAVFCSTSAFLTQKQQAAGSTTATSPVAAAAAAGLASAPSLLRAYSHTGISSATVSRACCPFRKVAADHSAFGHFRTHLLQGLAACLAAALAVAVALAELSRRLQCTALPRIRAATASSSHLKSSNTIHHPRLSTAVTVTIAVT